MPRSDDSFQDLSDGRLIVAVETNFSTPKALHKAQHFVGHVVNLTFALDWNHSKIASLATCQHQPKSSFVVRCSLWLWVQAILLLRHTEVHRDDGDACVVSFSSSSMWIRSCSMFQTCCAPGLVRSMGQLVQLLLFRVWRFHQSLSIGMPLNNSLSLGNCCLCSQQLKCLLMLTQPPVTFRTAP